MDAVCTSEQQALNLYLTSWGQFWNEPLHKQLQPQDINVGGKQDWVISGIPFLGGYYQVNGDGYKYIDSALKKATAPIDMVLYHGVEYMEIEIYNQLKEWITISNSNITIDTNIINQEFTSYGFISTTIDDKVAKRFSGGNNWTNNDNPEPPFGVPTIFTINVTKDTKGVAWVSNYDLAGDVNKEDQIMINKNTKYKVNSFSYEEEILNLNIDLIQSLEE